MHLTEFLVTEKKSQSTLMQIFINALTSINILSYVGLKNQKFEIEIENENNWNLIFSIVYKIIIGFYMETMMIHF